MTTLVTTPEALNQIVTDVASMVHLEASFPDWPFRSGPAYATLYEFDRMLGGLFGQTLQLLAATYGDREIDVVATTPNPDAFAEEYGFFPAFRASSDEIAETYYPALSWSPEGREITAFIFSVESFAVVGSTRRWAVYGQRDWEIGILITPDEDGPWKNSAAPWFPSDTDLSIIRGPIGWGMPVPDQDLEKLANHLAKYGGGE